MHSELISQRARAIKPSPTLAVTARAARLRAQGRDIIGLGAGEPDFDTPEHIRQAAVAALHAGQTRYTAVAGTPELRRAIVDKFQRENHLHYDVEQISVACGAKHSLFNLFQAVLDPGDEVLVPAPYWVSYPDMAVLAGARAVVLETGLQQSFKITSGQLQAALDADSDARTRLLVLNSPGNPSGMSYSEAELAALGQVLLKYPGVLIVTDDIYEHILWGQEHFVNIVNACPELSERCVVVNGVSKAYAMTGWRIGYAAGPTPIIAAMNKLQSQSTSNACSVSQAAALAALDGDQSCVRESTSVFRERHDFVLSALREMAGVQCQPSQGTFYIFPDMSGVIGSHPEVADDIALAEFFLEQAEVALVPGSAFGSPGYMRISFATSMENLSNAMARLARVIAAIPSL